MRASHQQASSLVVLKTLVVAAFGVSAMGASCSPRMRSPLTMGPQAPAVLVPTSSAPDIVAAINANTARVSTYQASQASFSAPGLAGLPLLGGNIAIERPQRFRLRATTRLTGPEFDAGGNEQRFWFWARRNDPPGVYTADYQSLASTAPALPIDPSLVIDALGLSTITPSMAPEGPFPRGAGRVEIRTVESTPVGARRRIIVVDAATAWPVEQQIYDARNVLVASVAADRFEYDPASGASLPRRVTLRMPEADMALTIDTGPLLLNAPIAGGGQLWQMPTIAGTPVIDLTRTAFTVAAAPGEAASRSAIATPFAETFERPKVQAAEWQPSERVVPSVRPATLAGVPNGGVALPPLQ